MTKFEVVDALKKRWTGNALDLLCEFFISFYAVSHNVDKFHILLSEDLLTMGTAFVAHKKIGQVFQAVYVKQKMGVSPSGTPRNMSQAF